jgi:phage terminase large subunit
VPQIEVPANGWRPRPYQLKAWSAWEGGIKRSSLCWHRRAGKDELSLHKACIAAHPSPEDSSPNSRVANYWHCLPEYTQARKAIWTAVNPHTGKLRIDEAFPHEVRASTRNDDMSITFKSGSSWRVVGSDNPNSLVGATPFGIVFSEWSLSNPTAWGYLQPMLLENGGWADFIFTPRGKNHAHSMHMAAMKNPAWFAETLTVDETKQLSPDQLEEARKDYVALHGEDAAEALMQQEYWCSFDAAILGAYWGKELNLALREGRLGPLKPIKGYPLHTAWDLGIRDSMVIWFFQVVPDAKIGSRILVLGCYSAMNYGIGHYAKVIKDYASELGLERGTDYVPHDARQREMGTWNDNVLDPKYGEAKQRIEVMIECGLNPRKIMEHTIPDGISAVRQILPRCWIDEECSGDGVEGLRQYQTEWDDEKKIFSDKPLHNWASHFADGFRTLAMAYREVQGDQPKPRDKALVVGNVPAPGFDLPTYDDIARMAEDEPRRRERI